MLFVLINLNNLLRVFANYDSRKHRFYVSRSSILLLSSFLYDHSNDCSIHFSTTLKSINYIFSRSYQGRMRPLEFNRDTKYLKPLRSDELVSKIPFQFSGLKGTFQVLIHSFIILMFPGMFVCLFDRMVFRRGKRQRTTLSFRRQYLTLVSRY